MRKNLENPNVETEKAIKNPKTKTAVVIKPKLLETINKSFKSVTVCSSLVVANPCLR
jgi:hypothetical protein